MILAVIAASAMLLAAQDAPDATNAADGSKPLNAPATPSRGPRVEDLLASGFTVVKDTKVVGDFNGCDYGRAVPLESGTFTCSGFGYMHATNPKAVVLKSPDGRRYKLVVEQAVFDGAYS